MGDTILNERYNILDTLYEDEFQSIYICLDLNSEDQEKYIVGKFVDQEIIKAIKDSFLLSGDPISQSIKETFEIDNSFSAVFPINDGMTLYDFLNKHKLTIAEKMKITQELLEKFIAIDKSSYPIQYVLCDLNNISIKNRNVLSFNNLFYFKKENLDVNFEDISKRLGYLILCIFANTSEVDIERQKDLMPPAIFALVEKANTQTYASAQEIYQDFKKTLLFTTFIDTGSLDNQIRGRIEIAQKKSRRKPAYGKYLALALIIALLSGAGAWFIKNKDLIGKSKTNTNGTEIIDKNSQSPIADFSMSINKVYEDDEVTFIDKSKTQNINDTIKSRLWTIKKDESTVLSSSDEILKYRFDETGNYEISLIVENSQGISSAPYTHEISVQEKPEIPEGEFLSDTDGVRDWK